MSITIADIMKLPSLHGAKVVAGHSNMHQVISAVSVLEAANEEQLGVDFLGASRNYGQEIVLTAFMASKDDVEQQCASVRRSHKEGEVGFIVFYVGSILPRIEPQLIDVFNELGMPLIVMPEKHLELRYSDVICEVMEAIINDRRKHTYFTTEVIERISYMSASQRSITGVLAIIRDRVQCSLYLFDELGRTLNAVEWPHGRCLPAKELYSHKTAYGVVETCILDGKPYYVDWEAIGNTGSKLELMVVKEKDDLTVDCCKQIKYIVKTYINLWAENYGQLDTKQLVSAIINNEPEKMRQIAGILKQNVKALSCAYFFYSRDGGYAYDSLLAARRIIQSFISVYQNIFLTDIFDETVVVFADRTRERIDGDLPALLQELAEQGMGSWGVVINEGVTTPEKVKTAYWQYQHCKKYLSIVFPNKPAVTNGEVVFVERAQALLNRQEQRRPFTESMHEQGLTGRREAELLETFAIFLLDADTNVAKTAELMFVHKNTVKFRIRSIEAILGHRLTRMPEIYDLYLEAVFMRLEQAK